MKKRYKSQLKKSHGMMFGARENIWGGVGRTVVYLSHQQRVMFFKSG